MEHRTPELAGSEHGVVFPICVCVCVLRQNAIVDTSIVAVTTTEALILQSLNMSLNFIILIVSHARCSNKTLQVCRDQNEG